MGRPATTRFLGRERQVLALAARLGKRVDEPNLGAIDGEFYRRVGRTGFAPEVVAMRALRPLSGAAGNQSLTVRHRHHALCDRCRLPSRALWDNIARDALLPAAQVLQ